MPQTCQNVLGNQIPNTALMFFGSHTMGIVVIFLFYKTCCSSLCEYQFIIIPNSCKVFFLFSILLRMHKMTLHCNLSRSSSAAFQKNN